MLRCIHCTRGDEAEHRLCVFELLKAGVISSSHEWLERSTVKTIRKGRIRALIPKELV